jgi:hypothetical protein
MICVDDQPEYDVIITVPDCGPSAGAAGTSGDYYERGIYG